MENKEKIIEESRTLFMKRGIRNVSMDYIAKRLVISKRTIYELFKDKNELLESCIETGLKERKEATDSISVHSESIIDAMFETIKYGIKYIKKINPSFFDDLKKYYPKLWKYFKEKNYLTSYNTTYILLRRGINEQVIRKEISIEIVAKIFVEQLNLLLDPQIFPHKQFNIEEIFENMVINFARGISTKKGIEMIDKYSNNGL